MNEKIIAFETLLRETMKIEIPERVARVFGVVSFIALIALGAHVKVFMPGNPVPMTLQTLFVLMAGAMLGSRRGALAVILYLTLGVAGLPMFASGTALAFGPTGGYLLGFVIATLVVGSLAYRTVNGFRIAVALILGEVIILGLGYINLAVLFKMGFEKAFLLGVLPFLVGDALKCAVAWFLINMNRKYRL